MEMIHLTYSQGILVNAIYVNLINLLIQKPASENTF